MSTLFTDKLLISENYEQPLKDALERERGAGRDLQEALGSHYSYSWDRDRLQQLYDATKKERILVEKALKSRRLSIAQNRSAIRRGASDLRDLFGLLPPLIEISKADLYAWEFLLDSQAVVGSVHTGVDGTYTLQLPGGRYLLYSRSTSEYFDAVWLIPIQITESGSIKIDFHNENASVIRNLKD